MEQTYPRFTPDMKKTHKILIPNMAPVQFRHFGSQRGDAETAVKRL